MRIILTIICLLFPLVTNATAIPAGFVYLNDIDNTIRSNLRYASNENFIGRPIAAYNKNVVILTKPAAEALKKAQAKLMKDGFSLLIYDAYRPQDAVNDFISWDKDLSDQKMKDWFYPRVDKKDLFNEGYIAEKSSHTRGSTVDLTIIKVNKNLKSITPTPRKTLNGEILFLDDNTYDMGSSFDIFDKASNYATLDVTNEYKSNRNYLKDIMTSVGFMPYPLEWWHFTLKDEPYPDTYFNFPIE
jgi:D-alanyl-D-alanine dipeptidase